MHLHPRNRVAVLAVLCLTSFLPAAVLAHDLGDSLKHAPTAPAANARTETLVGTVHDLLIERAGGQLNHYLTLSTVDGSAVNLRGSTAGVTNGALVSAVGKR